MVKINLNFYHSRMAKYRKASHVTYDCRYHIVWITKYRRDILGNKDFKRRTMELMKDIAKELYVKIIRAETEDDHVHLYVSIPVRQPIPYVLQKFKGKSSKILREEFEEYLKQFYWKKKALWGVGYFIATVGDITDKVIKEYVEQQGRKEVLGDEEEVEL